MVCLGLAICLAWSPARAVVVQFDYTYDQGWFTDTQVNPDAAAARAALEFAAWTFNRSPDTLLSISPTVTRHWEARLKDPYTGENTTIADLSVPADTVIVYVAGRSFDGATLAVGGPGGFGVTGATSWVDRVQYRGETGAALASPTDYGPWGGSIGFNMDRNWNFEIGSKPVAGQDDFLSVVTHELAHVLGFGLAGSWNSRVSEGYFLGPESLAVYGGLIPVTSMGGHWAEGTYSTFNGARQEAAMDPSIYLGTRKRFTVLDFAAMADIGWDAAAPGDANADGVVDLADLGILATRFDSAELSNWGQGDFTDDVRVDLADLGILASNYGRAVSAGIVPEPASLAILAAGAMAWCSRRRA